MEGKVIDILMVEDSEADVRLTQIAFKKVKMVNNLFIARDGKEGLDYLKKRAGFEDAATPDLIMLDLNLPRMNGHEVLKEIRNDPDLHLIPVVILTTSEADRDIVESYKLRANCYITKPVDMDRFMEVVQSIQHFWVSIVQLPRR